MYCVYKEVGQTPLERLNLLRKEKNITQDVPMTYAGRLDPMAEGLLLCLSGEECKDKEKYTDLSKEYEFDILVGIETDTHDILGLIISEKNDSTNFEKINLALKSFQGTFEQHYPNYSSKTINGKPLFMLTKENNFFEQPKHSITIFKAEVLSQREVYRQEIEKYIFSRVEKVTGDFRQKEILDRWSVFFAKPSGDFQVFTCKIYCSSGTYVRQLVSDVGNRLGIPCTTLSIKRTKVGDYSLADCV